MNAKAKGIQASLASAAFLGLIPVFGKQAILLGVAPLALVAVRTSLAAGLIAAGVLIFRRKYVYIYPAGLAGCLLAGGINGLGSLMYYIALGRIDAGVGQLIFALYPLFVMAWSGFQNKKPGNLSWLRLVLGLLAVALLIMPWTQHLDRSAVLLMLGASLLYSLHLPINQRVLYDMPAPTVTLYTLLGMNAVVGPAYLVTMALSHSQPSLGWLPTAGWGSVLAVTLATFGSRLALFFGVKRLGGTQAALLGLGELLVAVVFSHLWLGESLKSLQWAGALLMAASLVLVWLEPGSKEPHNPVPGRRYPNYSSPTLPPSNR